MGYYTSFTLLNESSDELEKIADRIYEIRKNTNDDFCYGITGFGASSFSSAVIRRQLKDHFEQVTWDDWEDDMTSLSEALPDIVLHLQGIGVDYDIWEAHFLNGKIQFCVAVVTISEFDPAKLQ